LIVRRGGFDAIEGDPVGEQRPDIRLGVVLNEMPGSGKSVKAICLVKTPRSLPSSQDKVALPSFTVSFHTWHGSARTAYR
jgi:hypothetical protein